MVGPGKRCDLSKVIGRVNQWWFLISPYQALSAARLVQTPGLPAKQQQDEHVFSRDSWWAIVRGALCHAHPSGAAGERTFVAFCEKADLVLQASLPSRY